MPCAAARRCRSPRIGSTSVRRPARKSPDWQGVISHHLPTRTRAREQMLVPACWASTSPSGLIVLRVVPARSTPQRPEEWGGGPQLCQGVCQETVSLLLGPGTATGRLHERSGERISLITGETWWLQRQHAAR